MTLRKERGTIMRAMSVVKVGLLAIAVALPSVASAKGMKMPAGACAFEKRAVANNTFCSYQCNPTTMWCAQQLCTNGVLTQVLPCFGAFCTPKCGG
jgi:hypothetical protein